MRLELRNTAILVAAFVGLALVVFFALPEPEEGNDRLFDFGADDVVRLVVAGPDREVRVAREGDGWKMESPFEAEADGPRLTRVLDGLGLASSDREIPPEDVDREAFGLANPIRVTATLADGSEVILLLGNATAPKTEYYVQIGGQDSVHLIRAFPVEEVLELISQPPERPTPTPTWTPAPSLVPTRTPTVTPRPTPTAEEGMMDEVATPSN